MPGPGGLATGQRRHRLVETDRQAEVRGDLAGAILEVGAAQGQPALQPHRIGVLRAGPSFDQALGRGVEVALRGRHPGPAGKEGGDGLPRSALALLWQVSDDRGRRADLDGSVLGSNKAGEQPKQGGLAGAVGADQTDDILGGDDQVEPGEEGTVAVSGGEVLRDDGGTHIAPNAIRSWERSLTLRP